MSRMLAAAAVLCALVACSPVTRTPVAHRATVVASFYPLYEIAQRLAGREADVVNLTRAGAEPHDLELSPGQLDQIIDADLIIYLGDRFQPALEKAIVRARGTPVDVLRDLPVVSASEPGQTGKDPHVWLDPRLMVKIVNRVERGLEDLPINARRLHERAAAYTSELSKLDRDFARGLKSCRRHVIVTSHAAFGYLASHYDLEQQPITGLSPESEPDPKRLAELADLVRRDGLTTVFTESLVSPKVAETLARETGLETVVLDPIEGISKRDLSAGHDYVSVMRTNLAALRAALNCS